jgi:predicted nucleic acid-binding protein
MMVLIDSSSWIESLRQSGRVDVRTRVHDLMIAGQAAWCEMVRLELWNGARGAREKKALQHLEPTITHLTIDDAVWNIAIPLAEAARDAGITAPAADVLIIACARHHRVKVEHCDKHMAAIESIRP